MKITKSLASDVATSMAAETIGIKIKMVQKELSDKAIELLKNIIPEIIQKGFSFSPDYIKTACRIMFKSDSLKEISVDLLTKIPSKTNWSDIHIIERDSYEFLIEKDSQLKKLIKEKDILVSTLESTLLSLSTLKRVEEQLPEALKHFPDWCTNPQKAQISLPIEDIKKMLKKYHVKN